MELLTRNTNSDAYRAELLSGVWLAGVQVGSYAEFYDILKAYYDGVGLYDELRSVLKAGNTYVEGLQAIRNPANAVVEFYASVLMSGSLRNALAIEAENDEILPLIEQVWQWSNWAARKQSFARGLALYGEQYLKVATRSDANGKPTRVYLQVIEPRYITDFVTDERDFLEYIKMEFPQTRRIQDEVERYTHIEEWDKPANIFRVWERTQNDAGDGRLISERPITDYGINFVPVVQCKFRDTGDERGVGAFATALEAIDEANRIATRLHQILFRYNKADRALVGLGQGGKAAPPIIVDGATVFDAAEFSLGDESWLAPPGGWDIKDLVPNINYAAALTILQDHMAAIEKYHLPELKYYRLAEMNGLSGRAIRFMLSAAIDRVIEARGNADAALIRANQMAITIGQQAGLFPRDIGLYEAGAFEHSFKDREDVIPLSSLEEAEEAHTRALAQKVKLGYGYGSRQLMREDGLTDEEIDTIETEAEVSTTSVGTELINAFNAGQ